MNFAYHVRTRSNAAGKAAGVELSRRRPNRRYQGDGLRAEGGREGWPVREDEAVATVERASRRWWRRILKS